MVAKESLYPSEEQWIKKHIPGFTLDVKNGITLEEFQDKATTLFIAVKKEMEITLSNSFNESDIKRMAKGFEEGFSHWFVDATHGSLHSYELFQTAILSLAPENYGTKIDEDTQFIQAVFVRAVFHDMAAFLPVWQTRPINDSEAIVSGKQLLNVTPHFEGKRERLHAQLMATLVTRVAYSLGFEPAIFRSLRRSILYHDALFWDDMPAEKREAAIKKVSRREDATFIDADHSGSIGEVQETVEGIIDRNRKNSKGKWYFLRQDLSVSERKKWQTRTGGLFDGLSAMLRELLCAPNKMLTKAGRAFFDEHQQASLRSVVHYYRKEYEEGWAALETYNKDRATEWYWGLKNQSEAKVSIKATERNSTEELRLLFKVLMRKPVESQSNDERPYYGYSLCIKKNGVEEWFDPSVLIFDSADELEEYMIGVISDFGEITKELA